MIYWLPKIGKSQQPSSIQGFGIHMASLFKPALIGNLILVGSLHIRHTCELDCH
ncbi:unnamed protein product [Cunninghamella blakesleeana]